MCSDRLGVRGGGAEIFWIPRKVRGDFGTLLENCGVCRASLAAQLPRKAPSLPKPLVLGSGTRLSKSGGAQ